MRPAKEYVSGYPFLKDSQMIIDIIRSAQIEAVKETIERCKKETELNLFTKGQYKGAKWIKLKGGDSYNPLERDISARVDKQSISRIGKSIIKGV